MGEARRAAVVRLLKWALPLAAMALIASIFVAPTPRLTAGFDFDGVAFEAGEGLRLTRPRFTGRTDDGRPFVVRADWALPDAPDPDRVELGPLTGAVEIEAGRSLTLTAPGGAILPRSDRLRLRGGVTARLDGGYSLRAEDADVDVAAETLAATGPIRGAAPGAALSAATMRAARRSDGDYIWFEGGVRVTLDPAAARAARQESGL